jgi:hypothetical protein
MWHRNVFLSRAYWSAVPKWALSIFGVIWLLIEPIGLFYPESVPSGWWMYFALIFTSIVSSLIVSLPRRTVSARVPGANVEVTIKVGDIFDAKDNVIIGTNDVFDTHLGDGIISASSIQGQLVTKRFGGSVRALDEILEKRLADYDSVADETKSFGKKNRYTPGICIEVEAGGVRHFLSAYCRMGNSKSVETDVCLLISSLENCWEKIRNSGQRDGVSMAVLGSDFGRIGLTQTQIIQILVLSFVNANWVQPVAPMLTIYVHAGNAEKVDFSALRLWLRGVLWA